MPCPIQVGNAYASCVVKMTAFDKAWKVVKGGPSHKKRRLGGGVMEGRLGVHEEDPGTTDKLGPMTDGVEEVRDLVQQGMEVMPAGREVARLLGLEGSELMRAYVEAYR